MSSRPSLGAPRSPRGTPLQTVAPLWKAGAPRSDPREPDAPHGDSSVGPEARRGGLLEIAAHDPTASAGWAPDGLLGGWSALTVGSPRRCRKTTTTGRCRSNYRDAATL